MQDADRKQSLAAARAKRDALSERSGSRSKGASRRSGASGSGASGSGEVDDQASDDEDEDEDEDDDGEVQVVDTAAKSRKLTAACWNFFSSTIKVNVNGKPLAKCKLCGKLVTCVNTTNMTKHCKRKHHDNWYLDVKTGIQVICLICLNCRCCR